MTNEPELRRSWNLFFDDKKESHVTDPTRFYHIARTTRVAKKLCVMYGPPDFMSLDTTLGKNEYGEDDSVMDFLTYLKDRYKCNPIPFQIHESKAPLSNDIDIFMKNWYESIA